MNLKPGKTCLNFTDDVFTDEIPQDNREARMQGTEVILSVAKYNSYE